MELTDEDGVTTAFEYQGHHRNGWRELRGADGRRAGRGRGGRGRQRGHHACIEQAENGEDIYVSWRDEDTAQRVFDLFLDYLDEEEEGELDEE